MSERRPRQELLELRRRLSEVEGTLKALVDGTVDAVIDPVTSSPILLRHAQEALRQSELRYRRIVENAHEGILTIDASNFVTFVNGRMAEMLGYTIAEMVGQHINTFLPDDAIKQTTARYENRRRGIAEKYESRFRHKSGHAVWTLNSASPLIRPDNSYDGSMGLIVDITERKRGEDAIQRLAAIVRSSQDAIISYSIDGIVLSWNPAAERIFGFSASEAVGQPIASLHQHQHQHQQSLADEAVMERIRRGQAIEHIEVACRRKDGTPILVSQTLSPITDDSRQVTAVSAIARDITLLRKEEQERGQRTKLEAIGRITTGVAHDINTPMQFISDNLSFFELASTGISSAVSAYRALRRDLPPGVLPQHAQAIDSAEAAADLTYILAEMPAAVAQSLEGARRIAAIIQALKHFTHPGGNEISDVDLRYEIVNTLEICRAEYQQVAEVETSFEDAFPTVPCILDEINQVILNLVVNAAHAVAEKVGRSGERGRIAITARSLPETVAISISDTGRGIPQELRSRIFQPFFTTKGIDKGTGQGLYLAYEIVVKHHHGRISFESEVGRGTCFTITLPRRQPATDSSQMRP